MTDMEPHMPEQPRRMSPGGAAGWLIAGLIAALFFAGVAAGLLTELAARGFSAITPAFGGALVGLGIAGTTILLVAPSFPSWRAMSQRRRRYWASLGGAALVGAIGRGLLHSGDASGHGGGSLFGDGALLPDFAIAMAALWAIGMALACLMYHRAIDDHEERAWLWAGLAGWYAFVIPAPAWWVLHRAAVAPPIDVMLLFILSMLVNALVWLWLKFR